MTPSRIDAQTAAASLPGAPFEGLEQTSTQLRALLASLCIRLFSSAVQLDPHLANDVGFSEYTAKPDLPYFPR